MNREEKKNLVTTASELADKMADDSSDQLALMEDLSERQQVIMRFKMRGMSQRATAQLLDLTESMVSKEMKIIRAHYIARGSDANQAAVVGSTIVLFEEIEQKGWEVFHTDESKRLRALDTIMTAREKQVKLLMDLGHIKRAATEHRHEIEVSPLLEQMSQAKKDQLVEHIIQLSPGIDPTPPEEFEKMIEAEAVDYEPEKD